MSSFTIRNKHIESSKNTILEFKIQYLSIFYFPALDVDFDAIIITIVR